jgi:hypothetical protein
MWSRSRMPLAVSEITAARRSAGSGSLDTYPSSMSRLSDRVTDGGLTPSAAARSPADTGWVRTMLNSSEING